MDKLSENTDDHSGGHTLETARLPTDVPVLTETPMASVKELRTLHNVALACLKELVPGSSSAYSLPLVTPIGRVRIQLANAHLRIVRLEVTPNEGGSSIQFTLNSEGRLFFDVPKGDRPPHVETDLSHGVAGVLGSIAKNVSGAVKNAGVEQSAARVITESLTRETAYYENGEVTSDLEAIAKKLVDIGSAVSAMPYEESMKAQDKLNQPHPIDLNGLGPINVNFFLGTVETSDGTLLLSLSTVTEVMLQDRLHLPSSLLKELLGKIEAVQIEDFLKD